MSKSLCATRACQLLQQLKQHFSDFSRRQQELLKEFGTRSANSKRTCFQSNEKLLERTTDHRTGLESTAQLRLTELQNHLNGRRVSLQRAHASALRSLPKRAKEAKRKWLGELQLKQFQAERNRTSETKSADASFGENTRRLTENRATFNALEKAVRKAFAGSGQFLALIERAADSPIESTETFESLFDQLQSRYQQTADRLQEFSQLPIPRFFSKAPFAVLLPCVAAVGVGLALVLGANAPAFASGGGASLGLLLTLLGLHHLGFGRARPAAQALADSLASAHKLHTACCAAADARHHEDRLRIETEYQTIAAAIEAQWNQADQIEAQFEERARKKLRVQLPRTLAKSADQLEAKVQSIKRHLARELAALEEHIVSRGQFYTERLQAEELATSAAEAERWQVLQNQWPEVVPPLFEELLEIKTQLDALFLPWEQVTQWIPPVQFSPYSRFGALEVALPKLDPRLPLDGPSEFLVPLALSFPEHGSLLFETQQSAPSAAIDTFQNVLLRLLTGTPPGKLVCTLFDPIGLGKNFAGLMHLADYEESLINRRIWTQSEQMEARLEELSEHIEKVIQMYLRNEYANLSEYNAQAGSVAEKFHFLVVADFPANFTETSVRRLQSIAQSGPRCGIFTMIHWDHRHALPEGFVPEEFRKHSLGLVHLNNQWQLAQFPGLPLTLDRPPAPDQAARLIHQVGQASIDSNRVQVPFSQIAPAAGQFWTQDTSEELRISIGRTGATKQQYLAIGKGTRQHALFAGKTGSGKSTLFHVIITNLALSCSPDQVEFYLIDFKKGVEFKCYAQKRLPHARVVAIESDREFALSVLQRVDEELKRRGDLFRKLGVQDVAGYKRAGGREPMPRSLLMIDEFQEFFVEDDAVAQAASLLFDRIVRQGRAFGIHVLLGSQTLGGAYSLARATLGQMVIRVALQCNEADAYLIMDENNSAPRLLSRPGEGIYNDSAGAMEANSPFQVVWLPDDERDRWLDQITTLAADRPYSSPVVFEGNSPSDIRENDLLRTLLEHPPQQSPILPKVWLGSPNSIKGPTEVCFAPQSGSHLLMIGQREEALAGMLGFSLLALAAQYSAGKAKFYFFQSALPGSQEANFLDQLFTTLPHPVQTARGNDIAELLQEIVSELKTRSSAPEDSAQHRPIFVFIHGLHRFKKLRYEEDFSFSSASSEAVNPSQLLHEIISEGSSLGIHLLTSFDTLNNLNRFLSRKALSEFEMRIVFQMSANDSASLIDSPQASNLGLHRALLYSESQGSLETFRPYALPPSDWLPSIAPLLRPTDPSPT